MTLIRYVAGAVWMVTFSVVTARFSTVLDLTCDEAGSILVVAAVEHPPRTMAKHPKAHMAAVVYRMVTSELLEGCRILGLDGKLLSNVVPKCV